VDFKSAADAQLQPFRMAVFLLVEPGTVVAPVRCSGKQSLRALDRRSSPLPSLDQTFHARFKTLCRRLRKHSRLSETAKWNLREMSQMKWLAVKRK
jgi:hypothetical protein